MRRLREGGRKGLDKGRPRRRKGGKGKRESPGRWPRRSREGEGGREGEEGREGRRG
jgi:hypothetical protein